MRMGDQAPELGLKDQFGRMHRIRDYHGQWLVLYFYPRDDTPGCTKEACAFRDELAEFDKLRASVLGISTDSADSHAAFARKYDLGFPLLSDPDGRVAKHYGALLNLGFLRVSRRHSFIIDPEGCLARIYRKARPATHSQNILTDLQTLQSEGHR